jgi:hypothetical protein
VRARNPLWRVTGPVRYAVVASRGVWRSLVARFVRDEEAVGSNPATPTSVTSRVMGLLMGRIIGYGFPRPSAGDFCLVAPVVAVGVDVVAAQDVVVQPHQSPRHNTDEPTWIRESPAALRWRAIAVPATLIGNWLLVQSVAHDFSSGFV